MPKNCKNLSQDLYAFSMNNSVHGHKSKFTSLFESAKNGVAFKKIAIMPLRGNGKGQKNKNYRKIFIL
jgi:hypothetical protein